MRWNLKCCARKLSWLNQGLKFHAGLVTPFIGGNMGGSAYHRSSCIIKPWLTMRWLRLTFPPLRKANKNGPSSIGTSHENWFVKKQNFSAALSALIIWDLNINLIEASRNMKPGLYKWKPNKTVRLRCHVSFAISKHQTSTVASCTHAWCLVPSSISGKCFILDLRK